jgi:hypothetical protein
MVTLRSGTDYLRRLKPDGDLTEWTGVANLNMGEVKVLRSLTVPQLHAPFPLADEPRAPPTQDRGHRRGRHHLHLLPHLRLPGRPAAGRRPPRRGGHGQDPLPIVIIATVTTQGTGPFEAPPPTPARRA